MDWKCNNVETEENRLDSAFLITLIYFTLFTFRLKQTGSEETNSLVVQTAAVTSWGFVATSSMLLSSLNR